MARRGLLDLFATSMVVYAMVVATPVGNLFVRAGHWMLGSKAKHRPLLSYFETDGASGKTDAPPISIEIAQSIAEPPKADAPLTIEAKKAGIDPALARALSLVLSNGKQIDGHFDVDLPAAGRTSFAEVGAKLWPRAASAKEKETDLVEGVAQLKGRLQSDEAAVAACAAGLRDVEFAVARARAEAIDDPGRYRSFRPFLPADARGDADVLVDAAFALEVAFAMRWPIDMRAPISSKFGWREHPVLHSRELHTGTDIAVGVGTKVFAIADGDVLYATSDAVNGNFVKIDHGYGLKSAYCHASKLEVARGDRLKKGDLIALSGSTGRSTGPHLHLQIELNGKPIDPEIFFPAEASVAHRLEIDGDRGRLAADEEERLPGLVAHHGRAGEQHGDRRCGEEVLIELKEDPLRHRTGRNAAETELAEVAGDRGRERRDLLAERERCDHDPVRARVLAARRCG
jgi:murein DD-endopeptidase MepM/ murein hydrolase activator NlpD